MTSAALDVRRVAPGMPNAFSPLPGLVTGGQPQRGDLEALAREGVRTIVDLRTAAEPRGYDEVGVARAASMDYVNIPMGAEPITDAMFDQLRDLMRDRARRPVLVHCASGNRVAVLLTPYLMLDEHRTEREALDLGVAMGLRSPQLLEVALDYVARHQAPSTPSDD